jgi:hypothetical protein
MISVADFITSQLKPNILVVRDYCVREKKKLLLFSAPDYIFQHLRNYRKFRTYGFDELIYYNIIDLNELDEYGMSLIENIIAHDEVAFFIALLRKNFPLNHRLCKAASHDIGRLLNYSPGRNQLSLADYCINSARRGYYEQHRLENYFYDAANTTSGESSDGEEMAATNADWSPADFDKNENKIKAFITEHGKNLPQYLQDNAEQLAPVFVTYRGVHFVPRHYSGARRKKLRQTKAVPNRPTVSYATLNEMGYDADDEVLHPDEVSAGGIKTKLFFQALKAADDKNEKGKASRNKFKFPNLFCRFVQAYVMDYNYLFSGSNPAVAAFFGATKKANPAISTSYLAEKAMQYMSGVRFPNSKDVRLNPHYRRTTKKPKHPYMGYTDVYAFHPEYFWQHASYILDLNRRGLINISHIFQFEAEVMFESTIPGRYHYYRDFFRMPDFSKVWTAAIEREFGYSKATWTRHRNELTNLTALKSEGWIKRVMEHVTKHRAKMLESTVKYLLAHEAEARFPVQPYIEGQATQTPDSISPNDKSKWTKLSPDTPPTPFYQRMEKLSLQGVDPVKKAISFGGEQLYPAFKLTSGWKDNCANQLPDSVVVTGVCDGQIIIVNEIQYVIKLSKGSKEPTDQNQNGHIFIATPRLMGG